MWNHELSPRYLAGMICRSTPQYHLLASGDYRGAGSWPKVPDPTAAKVPWDCDLAKPQQSQLAMCMSCPKSTEWGVVLTTSTFCWQKILERECSIAMMSCLLHPIALLQSQVIRDHTSIIVHGGYPSLGHPFHASPNDPGIRPATSLRDTRIGCGWSIWAIVTNRTRDIMDSGTKTTGHHCRCLFAVHAIHVWLCN